MELLKDIGCIDADLVVQLKGRVACEMNSGEELICTECLFENQLDSLEPEEAVALMSAFVFQQRNTSEPTLTPKLFQARQRLLPQSQFSLSHVTFIEVKSIWICYQRQNNEIHSRGLFFIGKTFHFLLCVPLISWIGFFWRFFLFLFPFGWSHVNIDAGVF